MERSSDFMQVPVKIFNNGKKCLIKVFDKRTPMFFAFLVFYDYFDCLIFWVLQEISGGWLIYNRPAPEYCEYSLVGSL